MRSGGTSWAASPIAADQIGGWANFRDTQYSEETPLLLPADQPVHLPNNAGITLDTYRPNDMPQFYDAQQGRLLNKANCDFLLACRIYTKPLTVDTTGIVFQLDIGPDAGPPIIIDETSRSLPWGVNQVRRMTILFSGYSRETFEQNGARIIATAEDGDAHVWGVSYVWKRLFSGDSL